MNERKEIRGMSVWLLGKLESFVEWIFYDMVSSIVVKVIRSDKEEILRLVAGSAQDKVWDYKKDGYYPHRPALSMELVFANEPMLDSNDAIHWCCHPCGEDGIKSTLRYLGGPSSTQSERFGCRNCGAEYDFPLGVLPGDENPEIPF